MRYEFTRSGFNIYSRGTHGERSNSFDGYWSELYSDMQEPAFREKLRQALNVIHDHYTSIIKFEDEEVGHENPFTTNIIVPKRKAGEF
jgi:hypothetical protein